MQNLIDAENRVRDFIAQYQPDREEAERYAGDMAAQCYHYLLDVARVELAKQASE